MDEFKWINLNDVLSYNAPYNFITTTRGTGKTIAGKKRSYLRFKRCGEGVCWVRRIEEDTIRTKATFLNKKFFDFTGADPDSVRIKGNYADVRHGHTWEHFVEFVTLSKAQSERSADDPAFTLLLLDEGFVNQGKRNLYRGDEVTDFLDLYDTKRRGGKMQSLILGNRESVNNPYLSYFGITPPEFTWNGIRTYKNGAIVYMQSTSTPPDTNAFDGKVHAALSGTKYGDFKYSGVAKGFDDVHLAKKPGRATWYACFNFNIPVTAWNVGGTVYFTPGIDTSRTVITLKQMNYKDCFVFSPRYKSYFSGLANAKRSNKVYFSDPATAEEALYIMEMLGI